MTLLCAHHALTGGRVARAQELQLHYDLRHSVDPATNPHDFPMLIFKSFKVLPFGSFLLKLEGDLDGSRHDLSKGYLDVSQGLRFWRPPIVAQLEYSGGLGLFDDASGGYYVDNAYSIGASYPFRWLGGWGSACVAYRYTNSRRPSRDPQLSLYWGRALGARWMFGSTTVAWTQNRSANAASLTGTQSAFLIENEAWWRTIALLSVGSEIRVSRNVLVTDGRVHIYPTLGIRYAF